MITSFIDLYIGSYRSQFLNWNSIFNCLVLWIRTEKLNMASKSRQYMFLQIIMELHLTFK